MQNGKARILFLVLGFACAVSGFVWARVGAQPATQTPQNTNRQRRTAPAAPPTPIPESTDQLEPPPVMATPTPVARPAATPPGEETVGEDDVVRVETDLTNVLFSAVDRNKRFITDLTKDDIKIYEDNQLQEIFTFQRQTDLPISLAILVDTSISAERVLPSEKNAAMEFVDSVVRLSKDEVSVVSFTGEATLELGLTGNKTRIRRAIENIQFVAPSGYIGGGMTAGTPPISGNNQMRAGSTALWDALYVTVDEVLAPSPDRTRRAIILLTDGYDTSSRWKQKEAINRALQYDAVVYAIGIGDDFQGGIDDGALKRVAEQTGGRAYFPRNEEQLRVAFAQIQDELRSQYLIAYSPTNKAKDGSYRNVRVEVANPTVAQQKLRLTYKQGYFAKGSAGQRKQ